MGWDECGPTPETLEKLDLDKLVGIKSDLKSKNHLQFLSFPRNSLLVVSIIEGVKTVKLDRSQLIIKRVNPPLEGDSELFDLFPLTWTAWDEEKKRRMRGELIGLSKDCFFIGEIDRKVVGNVWYTHSKGCPKEFLQKSSRTLRYLPKHSTG
ncbi:hypothetical protein AKJ48_03535 [candidate division MSBL1 archaeon SCGC-AAA261O19]|uniref:Uncharacterized protein n=1 Tax=candidate division MSBL1 archaeon SCGC-AAA261O19 TaxID=1698277 RepID=A0A133VBZ9_9EURY|nr:hypothetical protein AKJ48_03535 [candidate division MSBL1 archaeon SCGC-AAA261O19]